MIEAFCRFKRFGGKSGVVWVFSLGRHGGRRLNVSFHRTPVVRGQEARDD